VRYLTGLGFETHLSKNGEASSFDGVALAGLEDIALPSVTPDLPYVIKSPWSYQIIEEILDDPRIELDAVVVPVRDLISAATSRVIREVQGIHQRTPWMAKTETVWEHWATTPGGTVFSLNPIDQARLLAVGFHQLIERLIQADVPILFLAFPRFAKDPDYLYRKLVPLLPPGVDTARAREVHAATFEAAKVRVEHELGSSKEHDFRQEAVQYPTLQALDNAALRRELRLLRNEFSNAQEQAAVLIKEHEALNAKVKAGKAQAVAAEKRCTALESEFNVVRNQLERQAMAAEAKCLALEDQLAASHDRLERENDDKNRLLQEILALRASRSWRLTHLFRVIVSAIRRQP
jgi:hypothetical protein